MGKWKFSIERTGYTWTLKWIGDDTIYEEKQSFLGLIGLICAIVLILGISFSFDLYLMYVGSSRIGELLDYLGGVKTVTGTTWESGTINGMLCNEKYKGDFNLQKHYTPENKRNHTKKTMEKCRVITFRKITNLSYRRKYGKGCRR